MAQHDSKINVTNRTPLTPETPDGQTLHTYSDYWQCTRCGALLYSPTTGRADGVACWSCSNQPLTVGNEPTTTWRPVPTPESGEAERAYAAVLDARNRVAKEHSDASLAALDIALVKLRQHLSRQQRAEDAATLRPQNGEAGIVAVPSVPVSPLLSQPSPPDAPVITEGPPQGVIEAAIQMSTFSPCRSKRGAVVFSDAAVAGVVSILGRGYNHKSKFECDGSPTCKATCRVDAIHAEQMALINAAKTGIRPYMDALHVKTVDGVLVASGGPSCVECSKLLRASGINTVWLYHAEGWRRYPMDEFHRLSVEAQAQQIQALTRERDELLRRLHGD